MATNTDPIAEPTAALQNGHSPPETAEHVVRENGDDLEDSDLLPDSPRELQEEILLLEDEVESGKKALRDLRIAAQEEKNLMNHKIMELEDAVAKKDHANFETSEELQKLLEDALEKEAEMEALRREADINDFQGDENEKLKEQLEDQQHLKDELMKMTAAFEAERKKVQELQESLHEQESVVLALDDLQTSESSLGTTPQNSPRFAQGLSVMSFDEKIAALQHSLVVAKSVDKVAKQNEQYKEENLRQAETIGELERVVEYYRLGLSPQPGQEPPKTQYSNHQAGSYSPEKEAQGNLIKAQDEQIENLTCRLQRAEQQSQLAVDRIEDLEGDCHQLKEENTTYADKCQRLQDNNNELARARQETAELRLNITENDSNLRALYNAKEVEISQLKRRTEQLERQLELKQAKFQAAVSPMASPREDYYGDRSMLMDQSLTAELNLALDNKERYIEILKAQSEKLVGQNEDLTAQVRDLSNDVALLRQGSRSRLTSNSSISPVTPRSPRDAIELSNLQARVAMLQQDAGTAEERHRREVEYLNKEIRRLEDELRQQASSHMEQYNDFISTQVSRVAPNLVRDITSNQVTTDAQLDDLQRKLQTERRQRQTERIETEERHHDEIVKVREELIKVRREKSQTEEWLDEERSRDRQDELYEQLKRKGEQLEEHQLARERQELELEQIRNRLVLAETKVGNKQALYDAAEERVQELEAEITKLTEETYETLQTEQAELREKYGNEIQELKNLIETLEAERRSPEDADGPDFNALKIQIQDLMEKSTLKDEEVTVANLKIEALEQRLLENQRALQQRDKSLGETKFALDEKTAQVLALQSPRVNLERQLATALSEKECATVRLGTAQQDADRLRTEIEQLRGTLEVRAKSYERQVKQLQEDKESLEDRLAGQDNFSFLARRLTECHDRSIGGSLDGSILIEGEVPQGLAKLLKEVHREGVNVYNLSEKEKPAENHEALMKHLERLSDVLTSRDSSETMVSLFKDLEQNICTDREQMVTDIKSFVERIGTNERHVTIAEAQSTGNQQNMQTLIGRLETIASRLEPPPQQQQRQPSTHTPNLTPQRVHQSQQVTPERVAGVSLEEHQILQAKFLHLNQRMEAVQLAKTDEQVILEGYRQRVLATIANILVTLATGRQSTDELDLLRRELEGTFDELLQWSVSICLLPQQATPGSPLNPNTYQTAISSNAYLLKANKELSEKNLRMERDIRATVQHLKSRERVCENYRRKHNETKGKYKKVCEQAQTLYTKVSKAEQSKRQLVYQKSYFLMRLELEREKIKMAIAICNELINDLPQNTKDKFGGTLRGLKHMYDKNNNTTVLPRYGSRLRLDSSVNRQKRARRNWKVAITVIKATIRMKILMRRTVHLKNRAQTQFQMAAFQDDDDFFDEEIVDMRLNGSIAFAHLPGNIGQTVPRSPRYTVAPPQATLASTLPGMGTPQYGSQPVLYPPPSPGSTHSFSHLPAAQQEVLFQHCPVSHIQQHLPQVGNLGLQHPATRKLFQSDSNLSQAVTPHGFMGHAATVNGQLQQPWPAAPQSRQRQISAGTPVNLNGSGDLYRSVPQSQTLANIPGASPFGHTTANHPVIDHHQQANSSFQQLPLSGSMSHLPHSFSNQQF